MAGFRNTPERYGLVARLFHGAMVLTIGANLALGLLFDDAVETGEGRFAALHATLGILTLALLVGRVVWRFVDPPPPFTVGAPLERTVAHAGHLGLYALALVVTLTGWSVATDEVREHGGRIELVGGVALPPLGAAVPPAASPVLPEEEMARAERQRSEDGESEEGEEGDEAGELWEEVHEWGSWALLILVLLHAAAAILHKQRKDGTWERMFG
jgi:cytochrome b561